MNDNSKYKLEQWTSVDFNDILSDKNIYKKLLENEKKKITPGLKEFMIYARKELNITQEEMACQLNIKQNALSRYENGKRKVPFEIFLAVAEMLGYEFIIRKRKEKLATETD